MTPLPRFSTVVVLAAALVAYASPTPLTPSSVVRRQTQGDISPLSTAQIASFKPYTHYASTAYCQPATTRTWDCGANCEANPSFMPVDSGGDGVITQFCTLLLMQCHIGVVRSRAHCPI